MKTIAIIAIPLTILIVFGSAFNYENIGYRAIEYVEYIGDNVSSVSLTNGHSFDKGFSEASLAFLYVLTLPLRIIWALFQGIYYTFTYWGVTI